MTPVSFRGCWSFAGAPMTDKEASKQARNNGASLMLNSTNDLITETPFISTGINLIIHILYWGNAELIGVFSVSLASILDI
jgi:hypothetical protein